MDSAGMQIGHSLTDRLKMFKDSEFDSDAYLTSRCHTMTEKEIKQACTLLNDLRKASAEEMRKSVYANYISFIRTSKEISDLEGELISVRNLLSTHATLVHGLAEGICLDSLSSGSEKSEVEEISVVQNTELSITENWFVQFLDKLEVLLTEKRVEEAMAALDEGEQLATKEAKNKQTLSADESIPKLKNTVVVLRQKLVDQLAEATCQPFTRGAELRSAILAIKKLGDAPRAHTLLLNSHQLTLQRGMQSLYPSSTSSGGAFITALSRLVFSTIVQAASDSSSLFGEERAYSSELVTWAIKQTEAFALVLKRHVLASSIAAGSLRVASECIQICLGYCSLLEDRGLALSPILLRLLRPSVEQTFNSNLKRIEQSSAALANTDDWVLDYATSSLSSVSTSQPKLSSSAHGFNSMVQEFLEDVSHLESLQLDGPALEGVLQVLNFYVSLLINALPGSIENVENVEGSGRKLVQMAETESQQMALLANASLLADELLPRAALKLLPWSQSSKVENAPKKGSDRQSHSPEQREWKRKLQRSADRLRDSFCRQNALDLIFAEEGDIHLNAQIYTSLDGKEEEPEWFPSPIFQVLFEKMTRLAIMATDMFASRERFATILLMRLLETVIFWLSDDQGFWEEIEQGDMSLGPFGLQQFYLDMEFVMLFASQGRYLSRNLQQVIKDIIKRAIDAVSAKGIDPHSVLPQDDWFAEVAQIAIKVLSGKANFDNMDRNVSSPTASTSVSSAVSPLA